MVREIMYVIQHGRTRKVWIDPKDIYDKSDVAFIPPDYPTKEMLAEKAIREAEKAKEILQARQKELHEEWNTEGAAKPEKKIEKKIEPVKAIVKEKEIKRKSGRPRK